MFKVGDRVERIGPECYVPIGTKGKVAKILCDQWVMVEWEWNSDITSYSFEQQQKWLKLLASGLTLPEACAAYTRACEAFEAAQEAVERAKLAVADARIDVESALESDQ